MHGRIRRGEIPDYATHHHNQRLLVVLGEVPASTETHHADVLHDVLAGGAVRRRQALELRVERGEEVVGDEAVAGKEDVEGTKQTGVEKRSVALAELG